MKEYLSYCGYRCDLCPAYHENLGSDEDRKRVSQDWLKYYDHAEEPGSVDCKGCKAGAKEGKVNCMVRPCAAEKDIVTCAECDEFPCGKVQIQIEAIKPIAEKHGGSMTPEDYDRYIAPYESEERLRKLKP